MIASVVAEGDLAEERADRPIERVPARPAMRCAVLRQPRPQRAGRQAPPVGLPEFLDELLEIDAVLELRLVGEGRVDGVGLVVGHDRADLARPVDLPLCRLLPLPLALVLRLRFVLEFGDDAAELVNEMGSHVRHAFAPGRIYRRHGLTGLGCLDRITNRHAASVVQADSCPAVLAIILARAEVVPRGPALVPAPDKIKARRPCPWCRFLPFQTDARQSSAWSIRP